MRVPHATQRRTTLSSPPRTGWDGVLFARARKRWCSVRQVCLENGVAVSEDLGDAGDGSCTYLTRWISRTARHTWSMRLLFRPAGLLVIILYPVLYLAAEGAPLYPALQGLHTA